jgi:hypothetical protein
MVCMTLPLEGDGFELLVPRHESPRSEMAGPVRTSLGNRQPSSAESLWTLRWRRMDSNFQYASAVNLVVAPLSRPAAWD